MDAEEEEQQLKDESDENGDDPSKYQLSLLTENTNSICVYGRPIKRVKANSIVVILIIKYLMK